MSTSSMSFSKDVVQDMIATFGKESAIEQLTSACRAWIEVLVEEAEKETE
jgi:hypothetical protein